MTQEIIDWLWISSNPYMSCMKKWALLRHFGDPSSLKSANRKDIQDTGLVVQMQVDSLKDYHADRYVDTMALKMAKLGVQFIPWVSDQYPTMLKTLVDPPVGLFVRGEFQDKPSISIVGTRRPSGYGIEMTKRLSTELSRNNMQIVSGLARGIDTVAHVAALSFGGSTVAVLACGVDVVYPPENKQLMDRIAASGAIISEYPLGTAPHKIQFPIRNRIISGLSLGTIVVEAAEKSGSLITAQCAVEQGRDVFAVPGNVTSINSAGPNRLIAEGARMVRHEMDVLDELAWGVVSRVPSVNKPHGHKLDRRHVFPGDEVGRHIYEALCIEASCPDQLVLEIGVAPNIIQQTLLLLELEGIIKRDLSGCFHPC